MDFRRKLAASLLSTAVLTSGFIPVFPVHNSVYALSQQPINATELAQKLRSHYDLLLPEEKQLLRDARSYLDANKSDMNWWKNTLKLEGFVNAAKAREVTSGDAISFVGDLVSITNGFDPNKVDGDIEAFRAKHAATFHKLTKQEYTLNDLLNLVGDIEQNAQQIIGTNEYKGRIALFLAGQSSQGETLHTLTHDIVKKAIEQSLAKPDFTKFNGKLGELNLSIEQVLGYTIDLENTPITSDGKTLGHVRDTFLVAGARKYLYADMNGNPFRTTDRLSVVSNNETSLRLIANPPSSLQQGSSLNVTSAMNWEVTDANGNVQPNAIVGLKGSGDATAIAFKPQANSKFITAKTNFNVQGSPLKIAQFELVVTGSKEVDGKIGIPTPLPVQANVPLTDPIIVKFAEGILVELPTGLILPAGATTLTVTETQQQAPTGLTAAGKVLNFSFGQPVNFGDNRVTITIPFNAGANPDKVAIFYFNETTGRWEYNTSQVNGSLGIVNASVGHFSIYGVLNDEVAPTSVGVAESSKTSGSVTLSMSASDPSGIKGYEIYRDGTKVATTTQGQNTFEVTGLNSSTAYKFKVAAIDNLNNVSGLSPELSVTTSAPSTGGGGGIVTPAPELYTLTDIQVNDAIKVAQDKNAKAVVINVNTKDSVAFTPAQLKLIAAAGKPMELQLGNATFTFPAGALDMPEVNNASKVVFTAKALSDSASRNAVTEATNGTKVQLAGSVYELDASTVDADKKTVSLPSFKSSVQVAFKVPQSAVKDASANKLKAYRYDADKKQWNVVGGTYNSTAQTLSFETGHFSKYAMMVAKDEVVQPPVVTTPDFIDINGHWAQKDIEFMAANGYVNGTGKGKFSPDKVTTRAEFVAMLVNILKPTEQGTAPFKDVPAGHWYTESVRAAYAAGLVNGTSKTTFSPNKVVTREQMAAMIVNAMKYKGIEVNVANVDALLNAFADKRSISPWAKQAAAQAVQAAIVNGQKKGSILNFAPKANATRAEAVVMLKHMLEKQ